MKKVWRPRGKRSLLTGLIAGLCAFAIPTGSASAQTFSCDAFGYLFQTEATDTQTDIVQVDLATGDQNAVGTVGTPPPAGLISPVNAVGYNVLDDYFYGMQYLGPPAGPFTSSLVQIHSDGSVTDLGVPTGPGGSMNAAGSYPIGEVDPNGHYWAIDSTTTPDTWYEVDLNTTPPALLDSGPVNLPAGIASFGNDWSWINGALYGFGYVGTDEVHLLRFDPATGTFDPPVAQLPIPREGLDQGGVIGASFVDSSGYLYASQNATNIIYRIDPATGQTIPASDGAGVSPGNDGARCADAPIPTVTVTKTVDGRVDPADQFTVGLEDDAGTVLDSATTSGTDTTASTIDWPVSQGDTYTITDAMAAGSTSGLGRYDKSIECTDSDGNEVATSGSAPNWTLTVEATEYTCEVTNGPPEPKGKPKLVLKKKTPKGTVRPGEVIQYKITVRNKGESAAKRVKVCDKLPSGLELMKAAGAKKGGSKACWTLNRLGAGKKKTLKVVAQVKTSTGKGSLTNRATAKGRNTKRTKAKEKVKVETAQDPCATGRIAARC